MPRCASCGSSWGKGRSRGHKRTHCHEAPVSQEPSVFQDVLSTTFGSRAVRSRSLRCCSSPGSPRHLSTHCHARFCHSHRKSEWDCDPVSGTALCPASVRCYLRCSVFSADASYRVVSVGDLRLRPPHTLSSFSGIFNATEFGNQCFQQTFPNLTLPSTVPASAGGYLSRFTVPAPIPQSEDCTYRSIAISCVLIQRCSPRIARPQLERHRSCEYDKGLEAACRRGESRLPVNGSPPPDRMMCSGYTVVDSRSDPMPCMSKCSHLVSPMTLISL